MKKILFLLMLACSINIAANSQEKHKLKKTSTIPQKAHNTVSKHKKYKGYKIKHKHNGHKHKRKVDYKDGEVKNKNK